MAKKTGSSTAHKRGATERSGDVCPETGFWKRSCGCRLISVKKGDRFPPCQQCGRSIEFERAKITDPAM